MNFDFSEQQALVREQVGRLLKTIPSSDLLRKQLDGGESVGAHAWSAICEMAIPATGVPEGLGGNGLGYLDLCVIAEEIGKANPPIPFAQSRLHAMELLLELDKHDECADALRTLAAGTSTATVADCRRPLTAQLKWSSRAISGKFVAKFDGQQADWAVLICPESRVYLVDLGADEVEQRVSRLPGPSWPETCISVQNARIRALGSGATVPAELARAEARSAVLIAFQQLGGAQACLESAVAFACERQAFGRAIGSFQALKHTLADIYVALELARSNCYFGAWALAQNAKELPFAGAVAHASASKAYLEAAKASIQIHGGMGFTWEMDCHLHYRRALWLASMLGGQAYWNARIARLAREEYSQTAPVAIQNSDGASRGL